MNQDVYYHYTTIPGFFGIISARSVWFTDYRFLNDKHELKLGLNAFLSHFPEEKRASFERGFGWDSTLNHHCVLSLSKSPKILSQWRSYAADGEGVAVGFHKSFMSDEKIDLVDCRYENHEIYLQDLANQQAQFVDAVHQASEQFRETNDFIHWVDAHNKEFTLLIHALMALKNPAFIEEQEVRAVLSLIKSKLKFRQSGQLLIPYTTVEFWGEDEFRHRIFCAVREIWLGPKCNNLNKITFVAMDLALCNIQQYDCGYC